jgi:hypothetical protein
MEKHSLLEDYLFEFSATSSTSIDSNTANLSMKLIAERGLLAPQHTDIESSGQGHLLKVFEVESNLC